MFRSEDYCADCGMPKDKCTLKEEPKATDRQVKAVEKAIEGWLPNDGLAYPTEQMAKAAIAASDASLVLGLVARVDELRDALLDMVWQFCSRNDKLAHSFMSAEEHAFDVLDLDNGMTYEEAEAASKEVSLPPEYRNATQEKGDD